MSEVAFPAAAVLLAAFGFLVVAGFAATLVRSLVRSFQSPATSADPEAVRQAIADHINGSEEAGRLRSMTHRAPQVLESCLLEFEDKVTGGGMDRLFNLMTQLGLVQRWTSQRASRNAAQRRAAYRGLAFACASESGRRSLGAAVAAAATDADRAVRLEGARALAYANEAQEVLRSFQHALTGSRLDQIVLAEALRRHAYAICGAAAPEALHSAKPAQVLAMVQMLIAWERAVSADEVHRLLGHRDPAIRIETLRLATRISLDGAGRAAVAGAMQDPDAEVAAVAALAAAELQMEDALPFLARLLRVGSADAARSAAAALAKIQPKGWAILQELSATGKGATSSVAGEALDRARGKSAS